MTRFFKVSLSVVALLLVSLLVFTGCNKTADKALTAAEEAMQAVTAATADFEAAIANKADASKLADEVDALTKAIEDAELVAKDGDSALKGAIAAAKVALTENTQAVVNALDIRIAELLAGKADSVVLDAELARFEKILENINNATGAYLKLNDFVSFSAQAGAHAYELEQNFKRIEALKDSYGDDWAEIEKAYTIAKVTIYRATSMTVIKAALAQFDKAVSDNPNEIDDFYYNYVLKYKNGELSQYTAEGIYGVGVQLYNNATDVEKAVIADYYGKGNLVLTALEMWRAELTDDMRAIGKLYIVGDADDENAINATETSRAAFASAVSQCNAWFGNDSARELVVPADYTANVARLAVMANAADDADDVITMGNNYAIAYPDGAALDQANINAIKAWKEAYDGWKSIYLLELQEYQKNDADCKESYDLVKALIAPTEEALNTAVNSLKALAKTFIDTANTAFINEMKANFYTGSALDLDRVTILSGDKITALKDKAQAWAAEYDEALELPAFVYANANDVRTKDAYANVAVIDSDYNDKVEAFTALYNTNKSEITAEHLNMYNTAASNILAAFEGLEWGNVTSIKLSDDYLFQKSEYVALVALENERIGFINGAKAHLEKITTAYNELKATQTKADFDEAKAELDELVDAYKDGSYAEAELATYCAYDEMKTLVNIALGIALPADMTDDAITLQENYVLVNDAYKALDTLNKTDNEDLDAGEYAAAKADLVAKLAAYEALEGYDTELAALAQACIDAARV